MYERLQATADDLGATVERISSEMREGIVPVIIMMAIGVLLITYFPSMTTTLPGWLASSL